MSETSTKQVCLLDWDGTLRDGYVIFDWLEYLVENNKVDESFKHEMEHIKNRHLRHHTDYETMAFEAVNNFSQAMKGISPTDLQNLITSFWQEKQNLFDFTIPLIELLHELEIEPIVVTGSPLDVVRPCAANIGIETCFGLEFGVKAGLFDGTTILNTAVHRGKKAIVDQIKKHERTIALSFGDSESDMPLFEAAFHAYGIASDEKANDLAQKMAEALPKTLHEVLTPSDLSSKLDELRQLWVASGYVVQKRQPSAYPSTKPVMCRISFAKRACSGVR